MIHERVLRCMRAVDSWVHTGLARADRLHAYAHRLLVLWETWALKLDIRRRILTLASKFFVDSSSAFTTLDSLENHLHSLSSNSLCSSEDLLREYHLINEQLVQSTELPLREGQILLEKTSATDDGTRMLRERVYELQRRIEHLRHRLREEYEKLDRQGSSLYRTFDQQCEMMESWLNNGLERFLHSNRVMVDLSQSHIDITKQANDFLEAHQQILERDLKVSRLFFSPPKESPIRIIEIDSCPDVNVRFTICHRQKYV